MDKAKNKFVIFAHSGTYDKLHQVATITLTAAAMGKEVSIILFFWALKKFSAGTVDRGEFPVEYRDWADKIIELMRQKKVPTVSEMIREAKGVGKVRVIVCSAGLEYMDISKETKSELIDEVWGLPRVLTLIEDAETVLYI